MVISSQKLHQQPLLLWGQPCANAQCSAGILAVLDSSKTTEYLPPKTLNFEVSTDVSKKNLRETPNIFNWVEIGTFWGCSPPNNALVVKKTLCVMTAMFWIIVLLKMVGLREYVLDEWGLTSFQNSTVSNSCHHSCKDYNLCRTSI